MALDLHCLLIKTASIAQAQITKPLKRMLSVPIGLLVSPSSKVPIRYWTEIAPGRRVVFLHYQPRELTINMGFPSF